MPLDGKVAEFGNRPLDSGPYTYVWVDALARTRRAHRDYPDGLPAVADYDHADAPFTGKDSFRSAEVRASIVTATALSSADADPRIHRPSSFGDVQRRRQPSGDAQGRAMSADVYTKFFEVRWSDVDPNRHLRSTSYNEFAIHTRVSFMLDTGFDFDALHISPVVFRDEIDYRREVHLQDQVSVTLQVAGLSGDGARWRLHHDVLRSDGRPAATIRATGAWFDVSTRKLVVPPDDVAATLHRVSRTEDYVTLQVNQV